MCKEGDALTVDISISSLPRFSRFNHGQPLSRQVARSAGQPSALFIGTQAGLALALGRLAEIQHLPLTIFWSLQSLSEATLLSADVVIVDWGIWRGLQSRQHEYLAAMLATMPLVLVVTEEERALLPPELGEQVHVALLPKTHPAASILQIASRVMRLG